MSQHEHAHPNPNPHDDPATAPLLDVATVSIIVFVVTVIVVAALYFQVDNRFVEQTYEQTFVAQRLFMDQDSALETAPEAWIDKDRGITRIQLDDAMEIVAEDLAAGGTGLPPVPTATTEPSAAAPEQGAED